MSSSRLLVSGVGYDPAVGPQSTGPQVQQLATSTSSLKRQFSASGGAHSSIFDKNLHRAKHDISLSSLCYLFGEIVSWCDSKSRGVQQLESRLNNLGYSIGIKYLELTSLRENFASGNISSSSKSHATKREVRILEILQFINSSVWKGLFGKMADKLEKSQDLANQYMITDNLPLISKYISVPKEFQHLNCAAFVAGIVEGILDSAYFQANVSAHSFPEPGLPLKTVFVINFDDKVIKRESMRFER
ncbi:unnamed protein product [Kuraishia capsulata CBS 1993]|uniref:Trafficking protein particle complex subunit n=1 Tax=Kuraishia capsulata CBS 1993 TaxID=1382522 RepID=W6MGL3_9ASCO|nr:uncharacterized protein KUCA_T00000933001 [Kuraishia capsulata CBS 1993]CDK24966.1 unnamed protein product [Kuraishia capsulata CBS 1993]